LNKYGAAKLIQGKIIFMSANANNDDPKTELIQVIEESNRLSNWYETSVRLIISVPLFINAGAAIALTSFFSGNASVATDIKLASISFIVGTVFGIFTLIFEYLTSFFGMNIYNKHMFNNIHPEKFIEESLSRYEVYNQSLNDRMMKTIIIRIINGGLGIMSCFVGIFFIAKYIINDCRLPVLLSFIILLYFITMICLLYQQIKPQSSDDL
jgi:hypothetical protein